jgi:organic radical activating enzyme
MKELNLPSLPAYVIVRRVSLDRVINRVKEFSPDVTPIVTENNFDSITQEKEFVTDLTENHARAIEAGIERGVYPFVVYEEDVHKTEWYKQTIPLPEEVDAVALDNNKIECNHKELRKLKHLPKYLRTEHPDIYKVNKKYSCGAYLIVSPLAARKLVEMLRARPTIPADVIFSWVMQEIKYIAYAYPPFYHGPLSNPKSYMTYFPVVDNRVRIKSLEIHAVHSCNLGCKQCSHFSDQLKGKPIPMQEIIEDMRPWQDKIQPKGIVLLGGEPAMNPEMPHILYEMRKYFPDSDMMLVSNGFLLHKFPKLGWHLKKLKCRLDVSIHHGSSEYMEKFKPVKKLLEEWKNRFDIQFNIRKSHQNWRESFPYEEGKMVPVNNNDPRKAWEVCISRTCTQLFRRKLWKCPQAAYLHLLAEQGKVDMKRWAPYLEYQGIDSTATKEEIQTFFSREEEDICKMCPTSVIPYSLPTPLRGSLPVVQ